MDKKDYYTVAEVADLTGMSLSYVNSLITSGKIKALKEPAHGHGGFKYQIDSKEVDRLLEAKNGAIEAAKEPHSNLYIDREGLLKLTGVSTTVLKKDEAIGRITSTRVSEPGKKGTKIGYSVKEVKKYLRYLNDTTPRFVSVEEMEELVK